MDVGNFIPLGVLGLKSGDIKKCFEQAFCLNILVSGKSGVGKSSLINSLVGSQVCPVNDPGLEHGHLSAGTLEVNATKANLDGVFVTIYDSPGLQDGTENDDAYLEDMHSKCKDANLFLYCIDMSSSRFDASDKQAIKLITKKFEHNFWNRCVLVMTKANLVRVPPRERGREREYHKHLYDTILSAFQQQLIEQGVPEQVAKSVPGVEAGHYDPDIDNGEDEERYIWYLSSRAKSDSDRPTDFLAELWVTCLERTADGSQIKYIRATARQRIKPLEEASEAEERFKKQLQDLQRQQNELRRQYERDMRQCESRLKTELDEIRQEYSSRNWQVPRPSNASSFSPTSDQLTRMTNSLSKIGKLAASGASTGTTIGGAFGPIGTAVGGAIGGAVGCILGIAINALGLDSS